MFSDEQIARVTHEANRAYCVVLGDDSQPAWDAAPQWQRDSAIAGIAAKRANPAMTAEQQHENWLSHKRAEDWTYGIVKDVGAKTHPCMVPYSELGASQRVKDAIFGSVALAMLSA